jgi:hypothetical protein
MTAEPALHIARGNSGVDVAAARRAEFFALAGVPS